MDVSQFINHYQCPDDGTKWTMVWSCMCDDRCPSCDHEIVPYKSEDWPVDDLTETEIYLARLSVI